MFGKSRAKLSRSKSEALAGQCPEREDATKGSRLAAVQGTRFFPGNTPGRRPRNSEPEQVTNQTRGRPSGEDRSAALL